MLVTNMRKRHIIYLVVFVISIYYLLFRTDIYPFSWEFGRSHVKRLKIFFISNPPENKFDQLSLIIKHITEELKNGDLQNINRVNYIAESWKTNRYYNLNDFWNYEEGWQHFGLDNSIGQFILKSNDYYSLSSDPDVIECYHTINLKNYTTFPDTTNLLRGMGEDYLNFYFLDGINFKSKKHWLRVYFQRGRVIHCDTSFVPQDILDNKEKWKNLSR